MKKGSYARLAADNIRKNGKTYIPYILACIVTAAMFYIVKSLSLNPGLNGMAGGNFLNTAMGLGSWVITVFAFIFLFYTNSFLMKRRKKEFGVFHILGMERRHLARVIGWETFYVLLLCLLPGLGLGIALDKVMFLTVAKVVGGQVPLGFFISTEVLTTTALFFSIIFILIYIYSVWQIRTVNPIELLRAGNAGEREPRANWLLALLGLAALGEGYYIAAATENPIASVLMFFVAVLLVIAGTYLLFTAGSIALLKMLRKNKRYYYRTKHFVSVAGMIYRMKQNAVGLANICVLSTMVLVMVSTTTSMMIGMEDIIANRYPADFVFYAKSTDNREADRETISRLREDEGLTVTGEWTYTFLAFQGICEENGYSVLRERARSVEDDTHSLFFVPLEDYNRIMGTEKTLQDGEIMVYSNRRDYDRPVMKLFDREYRVAERLDNFVGNGEYEAMMSVTQYIVVPDLDTLNMLYERQREILTDLAGQIGWVYAFDTDSDEAAQEAFEQSARGIPGLKEESRIDGRRALMEICGGMFFIGIFLGSLFVMATVLIIYYKQISEGYDDRNRFEIMQKVGMSSSEVKSAIHSQILTIFFLPLMAAGTHVAAAFPLISRLLELLNLYNLRLYAACTVSCFLVFGVLYALIYLLTARTYYRIVQR